MREQTYSVPDQPEGVRPLLISMEIPQETLRTVEGADFDLRAAIAKQPTVLFFFRGHW